MKRKEGKSAMWGRAFLIVSATLLCGILANAGESKFSSDLAGASASGQVGVIVQYNRTPGAAYHKKVLSRGGTLKRELGGFNGAAYSMPASAIADLANDPDVVYISPDRPLRGTALARPPSGGQRLPHRHHQRFGSLVAGLDGSGIGVAVIDSGIADTADMHGKKSSYASNVVYSQDSRLGQRR